MVNELNNLPELIRDALKTQVNAQEVFNYVKKITKNLFHFDYLQFTKSYDDILHKNGNLVDVIIHDKNMEKFLEIHKKEFDELSLEYIKKINRHKESDSIR